MQTKKAVRILHLWLGLAAGLILSVVGLTGSLYVFEPELSAFLERDLYHLQGEKLLFNNDIDMAEYIETNTGQSIQSIQWPKRGRETYVFKLFNDESWYYLDQSTGVITSGGEALGNSVFGFILDLHTTLTMGDTGRIITGFASLIFAIMMLTTGLYLWYPDNKGRRKSSFKIKWDATKKRVNYDLHNVTGFYFFLPLFLVGITGASFYFNDEAQWVLDKITFSEPAPESVWEVKSTLPLENSDEKLMTSRQALAEMNKYYPTMYKRNLWLTDQPDGKLSFAFQDKINVYSGPDHRIFLTVDPYTGKILSENNPEKLPTGSAIMARWLLPIHFGEFGGITTRIIWFFAGLLPAFLTITGFKIWLGKNKNKNAAKPVKTAKALIRHQYVHFKAYALTAFHQTFQRSYNSFRNKGSR